MWKISGRLLLSLSASWVPTLARGRDSRCALFLTSRTYTIIINIYITLCFIYLQNHFHINLVTPQVFAHQSGTDNEILLSKCQCKSKLIVYLEPERYKNKERINKITNWMFSEAKISRSLITYPIEFTWITSKTSNKQFIRITICRTEMLWLEPIMFIKKIKRKKTEKKL